LEHEYDPTQHVRHLSSVPAEEEIEDLRSALTEVDIAHVRGQVRAYERLLSLESILLNHREQLVVTRGSIMEALDGPQ
jgi:hypothetical protein